MCLLGKVIAEWMDYFRERERRDGGRWFIGFVVVGLSSQMLWGFDQLMIILIDEPMSCDLSWTINMTTWRLWSA